MAQAVQEHHLNDPVTRHVHQKFIRLHAGQTVGQALHHIRQTGQEGWIVYFYVVDDENRLGRRHTLPGACCLIRPRPASMT